MRSACGILSLWCFVAFFFVRCDAVVTYTNTDILVVSSPNTFYDSLSNNFRISFDTLYFWRSSASGSVAPPTTPPGAGDNIDADFSSAACSSGSVYMSAVVFNTTTTPSYGIVTLSSTRKCRAVIRVEVGKTLVCDQLIVNSGVVLMVEGTIQCNRFVLQSGALMMGKGTVQSGTAQLDGDIIPGVLFSSLAISYSACNDCMASILSFDTIGFAPDVDTSYDQLLTISTTGQATVTGTIWIPLNSSSATGASASARRFNNQNPQVRFTTVQFVNNATLRLWQTNNNIQSSIPAVLYDTLVAPSNVKTTTNTLTDTNSSPLTEACTAQTMSFATVNCNAAVVGRGGGTGIVPGTGAQLGVDPQLCSVSSSGTLSVVVNLPNECQGQASGVVSVGGTPNANSSTTSASPSSSGLSQTTIIILAVVIPGVIVVVGVVTGLLLLRNHRINAQKQAMMSKLSSSSTMNAAI